jgi:Polyketide cyclase / dehydrase and lipid transport
VFALIRAPSDFPNWRRGVSRVEMVAPENGRERFREVGKNGSILYEIESLDPPRRMVTRIADKSLPFGGTWTFDVAPGPDGATLRIVENGEVYNPIFRFVSRFIMGHTATIDAYLADVQHRFDNKD